MKRVIELRLSYYQNLETGLVRSFLSPPKRGKWELTSRRATPHPKLPVVSTSTREGDTK
ncbi:hypothetical protein ACVWWD_004306 [Mesorhizobium sp. URHB0026]